MSIEKKRARIAAIRRILRRAVAGMIGLFLFFPAVGGTADRVGGPAKTPPARTFGAAISRPQKPVTPAAATEAKIEEGDNRRLARLSEIARSINEPGAAAGALITAAARLCGFSIRAEDRSKIAEPDGAPGLKLALTDTEIREYSEMFRAGHTVALGDLIGAMDLLYKGIGGQGSVKPHLMLWLQTGDGAENASVRALTAFLQDLGKFRPGSSFGSFSGDAERIDPIQALFILRVLTEDMGVPLRQALAKIKPVPPGMDNVRTRGPRVSFDSLPQEAEAPGWAEDGYAGGITGLYGAVSDVMSLGEKAFGKYAAAVGKANAILSITKFIATYTFLKGEMRVEEPGQPLIRTKDLDPGNKRTVVARFFIDGTRVTDWMKDHRQLVALAGLDLDMPKTGALKGVRTEWQFAQSPFPRLQLVRTVAGSLTGSLANVRTDEQGEARVHLEGAPQEKRLDPSKVMPVEKTVRITVTPQIKAVEMQQDLVDAVLGAIGIKDGPAGFVSPLMETLYRMNWTGEAHLALRVRDWQQAESVAQLTLEIRATGREFRKNYALQTTIDRSVTFENWEMTVSETEMPEPIDPAVLKTFSPEMRAQIEEGLKAQAEMASKIVFHSVDTLDGAQMSVTDRSSDKSRYSGWETSHLTTWAGSNESDFAPQKSGNSPGGFSVEVDLKKKTATIIIDYAIKVKWVSDEQTVYFPHPPPLTERGHTTNNHLSNVQSMALFSSLQAPSPVDSRHPGSNWTTIVVPLKEEPVIDGGGLLNYYGAVPIPFTFGPRQQFKGTAFFSYSITRKVVKPK